MFEEMITNQLDVNLGKEYHQLSEEDKSYADLGLLSILAKTDPSITVKRERFIKGGKIFDRLIVESPPKLKELTSMETLKGIVSKMRILKITEHPWSVFSLNDIPCLIASHSLNFLADVDEEMNIVVGGYYNSRKQFIVKKYCVLGQTKMMMEIEKIKMINPAI